MKRFSWLVLAALCLFSAAWAYAEDVRIGYVDVRKVLTESKAGQRVKGEIDKLVKQHREKLDHGEQELKDMQKAFEKDKLLMSDSQKEKKQQEFQVKLKAFQEERARAQREIDQKEREYTSQAVPKIREIIRDLAKAEKLTLVFDKNDASLLYAVDGPDLTDKVIERFDAKGGH